MKTKIILTVLLIASIQFEASAFKIILSGGGKDNTYYSVELTSAHCFCRGVGNNICPIKFATVEGMTQTNWHPLKNVTEFVLSQIKKGITSGDMIFENDLPISWKVSSDKTIFIDVDESGYKKTTQIDVEY